MVWMRPAGAGASGSDTVRKQNVRSRSLRLAPPRCHRRELYRVTVPAGTATASTPEEAVGSSTARLICSGRACAASGLWLPGKTCEHRIVRDIVHRIVRGTVRGIVRGIVRGTVR